MNKIFIIEDDEIISNAIASYLEKYDYKTKIVDNFEKTIDEFIEFSPDLLLIDINLPYYDGYYFCKAIRKISKIPIIFISLASEDMNIVMAIENGADDFIVKPFKLVLLKAKIDAILRRVYDFNNEQQLLRYKDLTFDKNKDLIYYKEISIELTKNESKILEILLEHKENIVTRELLIKLLWDTDYFVDDNTLSVNINRLRKKIRKNRTRKLYYN